MHTLGEDTKKIQTNFADLFNSGFKTDIVILTEKIQTIDKSKVKEKLGRITHDDLRKIDTALLIQLGIV
ncbi:type II toxin-antitoxin system PemK/MazF family toxin [Clostridium sp.]|uniref:type II toxin-antitoxin system PemK/MazF family toxin n=1 Tax=Clostridium sp. TaxID=1506 RepID=UPI0039C89BBD